MSSKQVRFDKSLNDCRYFKCQDENNKNDEDDESDNDDNDDDENDDFHNHYHYNNDDDDEYIQHTNKHQKHHNIIYGTSDDDDQWEDIRTHELTDEDIDEYYSNYNKESKIDKVDKVDKVDDLYDHDNIEHLDQDEEIVIKDTKNDDGTDPYTAVDLVNLFIFKQNQINNSIGKTMFHNVDIKDPSSTNDHMEMFYEYMNEYKTLCDMHETYIDIYDTKTYQKPDIDSDIDIHTYALIEAETNKILYLSMSYISLLYCALDNLKNNNNWNIIRL